jgi:hypothetical protein
MLVGYNTNISYKDKVYHIQTEDSGQSNPVIVTLLYSKGAILASKKTTYADVVADPDYKEKVGKMMREQHKEMIRGLLAGKHTGEAGEKAREVREEVKEAEAEESPEAPAAEPPGEILNQTEEKIAAKDQITKSLDDILLNFIMKRAK